MPEDVILEITESSVMCDTARGLGMLARLRLKGFGLSVDDFGTGYSSLAQLSQIPFTELKIDHGFVNDSPNQPRKRAVIEASLDLARKLDLNVVAEGVETMEEWQLLAELGCDFAQGYLISPAGAGRQTQRRHPELAQGSSLNRSRPHAETRKNLQHSQAAAGLIQPDGVRLRRRAVAGRMGATKKHRTPLSNSKTIRSVRLRRIKAVSDAYGLDVVDTTFRVRNYLISWEEGVQVVDSANLRIQEHWKVAFAIAAKSRAGRPDRTDKPGQGPRRQGHGETQKHSAEKGHRGAGAICRYRALPGD